MEKIHGSSSHLAWKPVVGLGIDPHNELTFFSGGEKHENFVKLFDHDELTRILTEKVGDTKVIVNGEVYGGKCQGMSATYGNEMKFIAFDVRIDGRWLSVPQADEFVKSLGLKFVDYVEIDSDLASIDAERDKPSTQAVRNGIPYLRKREGIVLRPPFEVTLNNGERLIAKHKNAEFSERKTVPNVDPAKLEVLTEAQAIADEWVVEVRLQHVIEQLLASRDDAKTIDIKDTGQIIKLMIDDVMREASGEIIDTKDVRKAIGAKAGQLFKKKVTSLVQD